MYIALIITIIGIILFCTSQGLYVHRRENPPVKNFKLIFYTGIIGGSLYLSGLISIIINLYILK
jgi:hypothetical protein